MAVRNSATMKLFLVMGMLMALCGVSIGEVYKVGDAAGWTAAPSHPDYSEWAKSKSFKVGDTIVFDYNKDAHDVVEVSYADFKSCNAAAPIHRYTTGSDSVTLERASHLYYICGAPGHCQAGQKVDIRVGEAAKPHSSSPSPAAPPSIAPAPAPSGSASLSVRSSIALVLPLAAAALFIAC